MPGLVLGPGITHLKRQNGLCPREADSPLGDMKKLANRVYSNMIEAGWLV